MQRRGKIPSQPNAGTYASSRSRRRTAAVGKAARPAPQGKFHTTFLVVRCIFSYICRCLSWLFITIVVTIISILNRPRFMPKVKSSRRTTSIDEVKEGDILWLKPQISSEIGGHSDGSNQAKTFYDHPILVWSKPASSDRLCVLIVSNQSSEAYFNH